MLPAYDCSVALALEIPLRTIRKSSSIRLLCLPSLSLADSISIVAIHGIGAAPDHTWCRHVGTSKEQGTEGTFVNWLQDDTMLPSVVPNACIMRYGYESNWFGEGALHTKVMDVARRLLGNLRRHRKVGWIASSNVHT